MNEDEFSRRYNLIATTLSQFRSPYRIVPLKRKCRFCELDETSTTFHKKAHLLSELLGKNNLISYDECDSCNELFSKFESHFSKYFLPNMTMVGTRGKKKVPSFHSRTDISDEETRTKITFNPVTKKIQMLINKQKNDIEVNEENNTGTITFRKPKCIPIYVYKTLIKYGLSLLPQNKISECRNIFNWLVNKDDAKIIFIPNVICRTLNNRKFQSCFAYLFEAKPEILEIEDNIFIPKYILIVCFANLTLQVMLPLCRNVEIDKVKGKIVKVPVFPSLDPNESDINSSNVNTIDFSSQEKTTGNEKLYFTFEKYERNVTDSNNII